jgi:hypothetical protein
MRSILAILLILSFFSCKKSKTQDVREMAVIKKIRFHVFGVKDYSDARYDKFKAEVWLQVRKTNYTGEVILLWDTVFSNRKIADFPQYANKIEIEKSYPVFESKDQLSASYSVIYDFDGMKSQAAASDYVGRGLTEILQEIGLGL